MFLQKCGSLGLVKLPVHKEHKLVQLINVTHTARFESSNMLRWILLQPST